MHSIGSSPRFGHVGVLYGTQQQCLGLLEALKNDHPDIHYAENWDMTAKHDLGFMTPRYAYVTGEHKQTSEQRSFDELLTVFRQESRSEISKLIHNVLSIVGPSRIKGEKTYQHYVNVAVPSPLSVQA